MRGVFTYFWSKNVENYTKDVLWITVIPTFSKTPEQHQKPLWSWSSSLLGKIWTRLWRSVFLVVCFWRESINHDQALRQSLVCMGPLSSVWRASPSQIMWAARWLQVCVDTTGGQDPALTAGSGGAGQPSGLEMPSLTELSSTQWFSELTGTVRVILSEYCSYSRHSSDRKHKESHRARSLAC